MEGEEEEKRKDEEEEEEEEVSESEKGSKKEKKGRVRGSVRERKRELTVHREVNNALPYIAEDFLSTAPTEETKEPNNQTSDADIHSHCYSTRE